MASFTTKLFSVRNGVATRMAGAMIQAKMISGKGVATALTAMGSKKGIISLRGAVVAPAPAALLRTSMPCCAASDDSDVVELQLKVSISPKLYLNPPIRCSTTVAQRLTNYFTFFNIPIIVLQIDGMVCDGCSSRVLEALQKLPGVKNVAVDLDKGVATVELAAASQLDAFNEIPKLIATVIELGFEAEPHFE